MSNVIQLKKCIRQEIFQLTQKLEDPAIMESDIRIRDRILKLPEYREAKVIFCFINTKKEIDTKSLIEYALVQKKRVCVPRCISKGIMHAFEIKSFDDLHDGKYGITEPNNHCGLINPSDIDFAIIPCVTCDMKGFRIGYGGGYYDRYLAARNFTAAVICRSALLSENVPIEPHDMQIDIVVTDQDVYRHD